MRLPRLVPTLLAGLLLSSGCTESLPTYSLNGFIAQTRSAGLSLYNGLPTPVHYVAMDEGMAVGVDLMPPESWPTVAPGAEVTVPYSQLNSQSRPRAVRVYWWVNGQFQPTIQLDVK